MTGAGDRKIYKQMALMVGGSSGDPRLHHALAVPPDVKQRAAVDPPLAKRRPTKDEVRNFARQAYANGERPNIAEAEKLIRKNVRAAFTKAAEKNVIRDILDEIKLAEKRRNPGKQVTGA